MDTSYRHARDLHGDTPLVCGEGAGAQDGEKSFGSQMTITFPWPDYRLSRNGRGNRRLIARLTKETRTRAAKMTDERGLNPMRPAMPVKVTYHPPSRRWDADNCTAMGMATFDGIADAMAVNDKKFRPETAVGEPVKGGAIVVTFELQPE